jgi:hypothetical protein
MFKPSMLSLPLLLAGASCVPPEARLHSAGDRDLAVVDLASMDGVPDYELILPEGATGPLPARLPLIDPRAIAPGAPATPFDTQGQEEADQRRSLDCLTAAVYYEARSESEEGQRAVAQVVLNRVRHRAFPNSVCGVVYQGSQRSTGCQFSFTCDGSMRGRPEPSAWDRARRIASEALSGSVYAPVGVATHYHTTAIRPWWAASLTRAITVGSHIFYRWRGSWGHPLAFKERYAGTEPGAAPATATPALIAEESVRTTPAGPVIRIAALVGNGVKVRIHRGSAQAVAEAGPAQVKVHRGAPASEPVAVHVGGGPAEATLASGDVAVTQ